MQSFTSWQFGRVGSLVGSRPYLFIALSIIVLLPGFYGLYFKLNVQLGIDEGFTKIDAPSRREISYQKQFFGAKDTSVPWYLATFAEPRYENGSMLNDEEFYQFLNFYANISTKIKFYSKNGTELIYQNICDPFCEINNMLIQSLTTPSFLVDRAYPSFTILSFKVNIGKFIFKRSFSGKELNGSKLMVFYFTVLVDSEDTKQQLNQFDKQVIKFTNEFNKREDRLINITLHGNYPVQLEVERGFKESIPLIFSGILLSILIFSITVIMTAKLFRQCDINIILWLIINIFIIITVISSSLGSICLLGMSINVLIPMTPFIGILIIINSLLIYRITDIWHRITSNLIEKSSYILSEKQDFIKEKNHQEVSKITVIYRASKKERMAHLYENISKDYLTFLLINVISFSVTSYFINIPNYQMLFSFYSFMILYLTILQLFLLCPIIMLTCNCYNDSKSSSYNTNIKIKNKITKSRKIKKYFVQNLIKPYSKFIQTTFGKLLIICIYFIAFIWPSIYGIRHLNNFMDLKKIIPNNSTNLKAFYFMDQHVWNDFLQFIFIMNNPPDFEDPYQFKQFKDMLDELESLPQVYGKESNMMWIYDYVPYELNQNWHKSNMTTLDMSKFLSFITNEPYNKWNDGVKWYISDPTTNKTRIDQMLMMITFKNVTSLKGKVDCLTASRNVIDKYPQFDIAVFDTDSATVDTILSVPVTLISVMVVITILTAIVSSFIMENIFVAFITTVLTISNITGIFGFSYLLNINLDALETGTYVLSSLIGNLMILQTISIYLHEDEKEQKLFKTLERMFCQSIKLIFLTLFLTIPVMITTVQVHTDNIQILQISVFISVIHSIIFTPFVLNMFSKIIQKTCFSNSTVH